MAATFLMIGLREYELPFKIFGGGFLLIGVFAFFHFLKKLPEILQHGEILLEFDDEAVRVMHEMNGPLREFPYEWLEKVALTKWLIDKSRSGTSFQWHCIVIFLNEKYLPAGFLEQRKLPITQLPGNRYAIIKSAPRKIDPVALLHLQQLVGKERPVEQWKKIIFHEDTDNTVFLPL